MVTKHSVIRTRLSPKRPSVVASILLVTDSSTDLGWSRPDCCEEPRLSERFCFSFCVHVMEKGLWNGNSGSGGEA